ncbi:MAG TPA: bifunctional riboflavin kinase/FAD synthetase [Candidatus Limnocylindrales bacterium]|nr:bifunctional riboflavin kinase/FAD synthetase [Candidatus Limnocylindrales bacterium]
MSLQRLEGFPVPGAVGPSIVTIGAFDGLHRGHMALLTPLIATARREGLLSVMVTFEPHPRCVLDPEHCPLSLTTLDEKAFLLDRLGLDRLIVIRFTAQVAQQTAATFLQHLTRGVETRELMVGYDFALGRGRHGDHAFLRDYAARHGFRLETVTPVVRAREPIASSRIRRLLLLGQLRAAAQLLGRDYFLRSTVEHGSQRGHMLGYPTANLAIPEGKLLPPHGVYAARVEVDGATYPGAVYIGVRPTFQEHTVMVEAYLFDFEGDLYGREMTVWFVQRLRGERRFATAQALQAQMARDVDKARRVLAT